MANEYFPHDYGARLSLRGVRKDFGLEGLGFYWCFVEILHEEGGYVKETDIENIAYDLQIKPEVCEGVIRNYDLFTIKKGKIWSERVLKNIKKRADISAARRNAADARWKGIELEEEPAPQIRVPTNNEKEEEKPAEVQQVGNFENTVAWYREVIESRFDDWANSTEALSASFDTSFAMRELICNILNEVATQKTLKINNRKIDTIKFLESLLKFFTTEQRRDELAQAVYEVEDKYQKGEIKNKQNYLISTLWNKAQLQVN